MYYTDSGAPDVRYTIDVDCIVDVLTLSDYHAVESALSHKGFEQSLSEESHICRWRYADFLLDVMPTEDKILGFTNRWYKDAVKHAKQYALADNVEIKAITAPYFLATKLEAFKSRGNNDYFASHDLEDIISIIDGRSEIVSDIRDSSSELQAYLAKEFTQLLKANEFNEALPGHLNDSQSLIQRIQFVKERIEAISTEL